MLPFFEDASDFREDNILTMRSLDEDDRVPVDPQLRAP
jgi:hypothetical protein